MHKKSEVNWTNIKGGCQLYTKAAPPEFWSDLTLNVFFFFFSIPQLDPVTNEIIETNEQVVINPRQGEHHPVIVRPAADWEICQPSSQSPHNQQIS